MYFISDLVPDEPIRGMPGPNYERALPARLRMLEFIL